MLKALFKAQKDLLLLVRHFQVLYVKHATAQFECVAHLLPYKAVLDHERTKRQAERAGRIKAEQQVRQLQLQLCTQHNASMAPATDANTAAEAGSSMSAKQDFRRSVNNSSNVFSNMTYPLRPIGHIESCFMSR